MAGEAETLPAALSARVIDWQKRTAAVIGLDDLSFRKEAEVQIEQQRIALEQNEKLAALGSLLAGVAHELNNPLSIVVGQSTLLLEGSTDPKTQARADKIRKAAERCTRIVRNFLALARRKDPERSAVDLNQVIAQVFDLVASQLRSDAVEPQLQLASGLPPVMADPDQLHQILTNLVLNAKQALAEQPEPRRVTVTTAMAGARHGAAARGRQRPRRTGRDPAPHFRAVFHHKERGARYGHRSFAVIGSGGSPRWQDQLRKYARRRRDLRADPADRRG